MYAATLARSGGIFLEEQRSRWWEGLKAPSDWNILKFYFWNSFLAGFGMNSSRNLILRHFIRNDSLNLVEAGRERLEIDDLAVLDGDVVGLVPVCGDFEFFLAVNEKVEAADALEERQVAHGRSDLTHDGPNLSLNLLELLRGRSGWRIRLIAWILVLVGRLGVNFEVPALENFLGVDVRDDQRELFDFVLRQPLCWEIKSRQQPAFDD